MSHCENKLIGVHVYVDNDIVFEDFIKSKTLERIKEKLPLIEGYIGNTINAVNVRPSSSGNAHLLVTFARPLTILENLCVRAWLFDDVWRLTLDLARLLKTGDTNQVNRLWSGKYKTVDYVGEMHLCGQWQQLDLTAIRSAAAAADKVKAADPDEIKLEDLVGLIPAPFAKWETPKQPENNDLNRPG